MRIKAWPITDVGLKRDHNEDSFLCNELFSLFVVADGMGGHSGGDQASQIAIQTIEKIVREQITLLDQKSGGGTQVMFVAADPVQDMLNNAIKGASAEILRKVQEVPELTGMGTTVVGLFFFDNKAYYAHVGDSRLYKLHDETCTQITTDHSLVQEQVMAGIITKEEAENSRFKNIITRSVGFDANVGVDCELIPFEVGDTFLLCSDGLTGLVSDEEIRNILLRKSPETANSFFVNLANSRGGDDNCTVIIVKVLPDED